MALELSSRTSDFREGLAAFKERRDPRFDRPVEEPMEFETILYEVDDRIATITFNRPDAAQRGQPADGAASCARPTPRPRPTTTVWTILVTGTGRAFCTGADVGEIPDDGRVIYDEPYLSTYAAVGGARRRARRRSAP